MTSKIRPSYAETEFDGNVYSMPKTGVNQHTETRDVVEAIPLSKLKWSLYGSAWMYSNRKQGQFEPLDAPIPHDLLVKANSPPGLGKDLGGKDTFDWRVLEPILYGHCALSDAV